MNEWLREKAVFSIVFSVERVLPYWTVALELKSVFQLIWVDVPPGATLTSYICSASTT